MDFKVGDTVRNTQSDALFVVVALPTPADPLLTVKYLDHAKQSRVDPALFVAVEKKRMKRGGHDREQRGGFDRGAR